MSCFVVNNTFKVRGEVRGKVTSRSIDTIKITAYFKDISFINGIFGHNAIFKVKGQVSRSRSYYNPCQQLKHVRFDHSYHVT